MRDMGATRGVSDVDVGVAARCGSGGASSFTCAIAAVASRLSTYFHHRATCAPPAETSFGLNAACARSATHTAASPRPTDDPATVARIVRWRSRRRTPSVRPAAVGALRSAAARWTHWSTIAAESASPGVPYSVGLAGAAARAR